MLNPSLDGGQITQHQKIENNITVSNPLAGTNYIISSPTYFQFFFVFGGGLD
jgi:hypothetical protein